MDNVKEKGEGSLKALPATRVVGHNAAVVQSGGDAALRSAPSTDLGPSGIAEAEDNERPVGKVRVLLVGDRTMDRIVMESRLSIDERVLIETTGDICSAAALVEWRHYSLLVVNVFGLGRTLVDLISNFSHHSRESYVAFFGGKSTAMVKAAEMIAQSRGLGLLRGVDSEHSDRGMAEFRNFIERVAPQLPPTKPQSHKD